MNNTEILNIINSFKKKQTGTTLVIILILLPIFLIPINIFINIVLYLIAFFIVTIIALAVLRNKYISPILTNELDPQKYYAVIHRTNNVDKFAIDDIYVAYLIGDYDSVINICSLKLNDKKYKTHKYLYLSYMARVYFNTNNFEELREICDRFYKETENDKKGEYYRKTYIIFKFFKNYLEQNFEVCKYIYEEALADKRFTTTPLAKLQTSFTYAIACYKVGDTEKAKEIFENIVATAPHLNFSKLAEKYLADINGLEKLNYQAKTVTINKNYTIPENPTNRKDVRKGFLALIALVIILIIIGILFTVNTRPTTAFKAISRERDIQEITAVIPLNKDGDAICLFKNDLDLHSAGYLNCKGKNKYSYKDIADHLQTDKTYSIQAPDSDLLITFAIYDYYNEVPENSYKIIEFVGESGIQYFTILSVEKKKSIFFITTIKNNDEVLIY